MEASTGRKEARSVHALSGSSAWVTRGSVVTPSAPSLRVQPHGPSPSGRSGAGPRSVSKAVAGSLGLRLASPGTRRNQSPFWECQLASREEDGFRCHRGRQASGPWRRCVLHLIYTIVYRFTLCASSASRRPGRVEPLRACGAQRTKERLVITCGGGSARQASIGSPFGSPSRQT